MAKKDVKAMGIAAALTLVIISVVCLILLLIAPGFTMNLFSSFMHGIDITQIAVAPSISLNTLLGIVVIAVGGYLIGALFALIYNKFAK